jgi:membrane protein implicated in regulation of membrane protease activity
MKTLGEQLLWATFLVLFVLWLVAAGMHLTGGLITYLLLIALLALLIRTSLSRNRTSAANKRGDDQRAA